MLEINEKEFDKYIDGKIVFLYFTAEWCSACKFVSPIMEEISKIQNVLKIDCDDLRSIVNFYGVKNLPTIILLDDTEEVKRFVGVISKDKILEALNIKKV